jgi:hypothetical protein
MAGEAPPFVEFELELADYQAMLRYACGRGAVRSVGFVGKLPAVVLGGFVVGLGIAFLRRDPSAFVAGLFVPFLLILLSVRSTQQRLRPRPGGAVLCRYRLQLDDAGMHVETPLWSSHFSWTGILAVDETAAYCFLRLDTAAAHAIPKRAFADAGAAARFVSFAREHAARAREAS